MLLLGGSGACPVGVCQRLFKSPRREMPSCAFDGCDDELCRHWPRSSEPVILLHGYTDSAIEWARTIGALVRRDPALRLIVVDQRGAGGGSTDLPQTAVCKSYPARCLTTFERARDVIAFADALKISRFSLVGHSMGSVVAREAALLVPGRVTRLVLVSTPDDRPAGNAGLPGITGLPDDALGGARPFSLQAWRQTLQAKGIKWPDQAYDTRLIEFDLDAVTGVTSFRCRK